jgi:hypothetical protein
VSRGSPSAGGQQWRDRRSFAIVPADEVESAYAGTDVPGEFRSLTEALGAEQPAVT